MKRTGNSLLAAVCIFLWTSAQAQDIAMAFPKARERFVITGIGITNQSFFDEAISNVRYQKGGLSPILGRVRTKNGGYTQLLIEPSYLSLQTNRSEKLRPMKTTTVRLAVDYQKLYAVPKWSNDRHTIQAGGYFSLLGVFKQAPQLDNSAVVYDYGLGLGVSARASMPVRVLKHDCSLSYQLSIPLVANIARPLYLNRIEFLDPDNSFVNDIFGNSKIVTVNKYLRFKSQLALDYRLKTGNQLRLAYCWDFYKMKTINRVIAAEHLVSFSFMFHY